MILCIWVSPFSLSSHGGSPAEAAIMCGLLGDRSQFPNFCASLDIAIKSPRSGSCLCWSSCGLWLVACKIYICPSWKLSKFVQFRRGTCWLPPPTASSWPGKYNSHFHFFCAEQNEFSCSAFHDIFHRFSSVGCIGVQITCPKEETVPNYILASGAKRKQG